MLKTLSKPWGARVLNVQTFVCDFSLFNMGRLYKAFNICLSNIQQPFVENQVEFILEVMSLIVGPILGSTRSRSSIFLTEVSTVE